jgi:uncharacterized membrane protein
MDKKSPAEQIEDLLRLKDKGALTEEEFAQAKAKLLSEVGTNRADASVGETFTDAASSVTAAFSNSMSDSATSYKNLAWILYWGTVLMNIIGFFPLFAWISLIIGIALVIVAALKMGPASDTIYGSHFKNIVVVTVVSLLGYFILLLVTLGTLGIGIIITGPLFIALVIWYIYRVVKGMMRLNENKPMA